jgi:hypothetical protein
MSAHCRITDPVEALAQRVAERRDRSSPARCARWRFPLSFLLFGLGFLGILIQRERRALHDLIAGTAVVCAWDARAARLRFLTREAEMAAPPATASPLTGDARAAPER